MIEKATGLSILIHLLMTEIFGLPSAGLIVPGYLALYLDQPLRIAVTLGSALATWALVRFGLSRLMILYGRRRYGITVLCGFLISTALPGILGQAIRWVTVPAGTAAGSLAALAQAQTPGDLRAIGHIVSGILAAEMLNAGPFPVLAVCLGSSAIVRLILAATAGF